MKNKTFLVAGFLLFYCTIFVRAQSTVTLSGHIQNAGNMIPVADFSEFEILNRPVAERTLTPDSNGNFSITFKLASPNYFRVGRNKLYLSPGDNMKCELDGKFQEKASFSGVGSEANNYLRNVPYPKAGSYIEAGHYIYPSPAATIDTIVAHASRSRNALAALKNVSPEFKTLEAVRIKSDVLVSIRAIPGYLSFFNRATKGKYNEDYGKTIKAISAPVLADYAVAINASFLKIEVYRDIVEELIKDAPVTPEVQKIEDWLTTTRLVKGMNGISDRTALPAFESKLAAVKTLSYKQAGENYLQSLKNYGNGDFAVDMMGSSNSLKRVSLSSLKGKVIFVDFWATWCGPCLAEMPAYEALKLKYKDNPNVAFVSISIDDESKYKDWLKNIEERKAGGNQWLVNRNSLNAYNITGIPRTIIIDKDFRIANMNAPLPSSKSLPAQLDKLLK